MKTALRVLLVSGLMLLVTASLAWAADAPTLKASSTGDATTTLIWASAAGDTVEFSKDGLTWSPLTTATTPEHLAAAPKGDNEVLGLTNYVNYYFRVVHATAPASYSTIAVAFPPDEHAHKYFASDTNMCAGCHTTHQAVGRHLINQPTINQLCNTCHSGTGSKYNVDLGTVKGLDASGNVVQLASLGGAFGNKLNPGSALTPTSYHGLDQAISTAPGGGPSSMWTGNMSCTACHSPHPPAGYQYRLLKATGLPYQKDTVKNPNPTAPLTVTAFAVTGANAEKAVYVSGISGFCGGCHADYATTAAAGNTTHNPWGVYNTTYYRHPMGVDVAEYHGAALTTDLPLEASEKGAFLSDGSQHSAGEVMCLTCHKPHGVSTADSTPILRQPGRSVCQNCHKKQ